jgi:hypothetical protein
MVMLTRIAAYLFPCRRLDARVDAALAALIEDARESGSLGVPEDIDTLEQAARTRLLSLVRQTPREIEVATSMLRAHVASMQAELTELNDVAQRAEALGLLASGLVRWAVARRTQRTVRALTRVHAQILRHERTCNQLDQWLDARVQLVCAEYRRAKRRADHAMASNPIARGLALAGVN